VSASGVREGDLVLDLGAGDGAITRHLVATGARVIAFELHPERITQLRRRFPETRVVRADVTDLRLPTRPFAVVANPPFDGVSAVLARLTHRHSRLERADLVVPVSVAHRWSARLDRTPWLLTAHRRLPRSAFRPPPRIDCCVIRIDRR
jgi:23S rRNA (adenine-N6)-dimethyltransferase